LRVARGRIYAFAVGSGPDTGNPDLQSRKKETDVNPRPCAADPDLWFGYSDDDTSDGAAKARVYEQSATKARIICLRRCPLAQQRLCAGQAVAAGEEYGVWAGIKLPGGQYRKRGELANAQQILRLIADGHLNPRELPESAALLARSESVHDRTAHVVHLSFGRRPPTAA
jgi:WhiB family redox-sensing transcriptional regulator